MIAPVLRERERTKEKEEKVYVRRQAGRDKVKKVVEKRGE